MRKETILVTATGSIIGEGVIKCLKLANTTATEFYYDIIAADMKADAAGLYRGNRAALIPSPDDESKYYRAISSLCKKHSIRAIYPGSDEELMPLAKLSGAIEKDTGAIVIANPLSALDAAVDKWKTYQLLKSRGLDCAESSLPENRREFVEKFGFPLIVKPRTGHGSLGLFLARNETDLDAALEKIRESGGEPLIQEYLPGDDLEYTTGVVVSSSEEKILSSISMRRVLKHGQTYKAFVEDVHSVRQTSEKAALALGAKGPVNAQSRLVDGKSKVFEINPRFSASCPVRAVAGVNEPDIVFRDQVLHEKILAPEFRKLVGLRYWNEVYVPLEAFEAAQQTGTVRADESFIPNYF